MIQKSVGMERGKIITLIFLFCAGALTATAQRTHKRFCECEYMVNGKCAYTLLLPTGSSTGKGNNNSVCPTTPPNTGKPGGNSPQVEKKLEALEKNLTQSQTWNAEQSRQLNQLQSTLIRQQQGMVNLTSAAGQCTDTCQDVKATVTSELTAWKIQLTNQTALIETLKSTVKSLRSAQETQDQKIAQLQKELNQTKSSVQNLETVIAQLQKQLISLRNLSSLCIAKGLIVSGKRSYLNDSVISSSSDFNENHGPLLGRINTTGQPPKSGSWCPSERQNTQEWLQFDLQRVQPIYALVTRGRQDYPQWVETYKFQYSTDGANFSTYKDVLGNDQVFTGNKDRDSLQVNTLWQPIRARLVRFLPLSACAGCNTCLRADIIGCIPES